MCCFGNSKIDSSAIYELRKLLSAARVKGSNASVSKSAANKHNKKGFFLLHVFCWFNPQSGSAEVSITFGDFC